MSRLALQVAALLIVCTTWSPSAQAIPTTDFLRVIEGAYVLSNGFVVGGIKADFHYNIDTSKLVVRRVPGFDFSERLRYTPAPAFQDQFWIDITYAFAPYAPAGFQNRTINLSRLPINEFEVRNGLLDEFFFRASGIVEGKPFNLLFDTWTTDMSVLSNASLSDILVGNSEGLFDCPGGPNDVCALVPNPPGLPAGEGFIEKVGTPIEVILVPTPGTLAMIVPTLLALVAGRRARKQIGSAAR